MKRLKVTQSLELENLNTYERTVKEGGMRRENKCAAVFHYEKQCSSFHSPKNFISTFLRRIQLLAQVVIS